MSRAPALNASLRDRAINAGQWRAASLAAQFALQLPVGIVLARLLRPADFGVVALAFVVIGFATMASDLGLGPAIVQRRLLTPLHLRAAFTASLVLGLALTIATALLAPAIGAVARNEMLPRVLRVQALLFFVAGAGNIGRALLQRALDFRRLFRIELCSYLGGYALFALGGALSGWGVWSLVVGSLVQAVLSSVLSLIAVRAAVRPVLRIAELRHLLGFGVAVSLNDVTSYIARNGDNFVVGRLLGVASLGLYARAFNLMMLPINSMTSALFNVLLPTFAEIQDDHRRVGRGFLLSVQLATMIIAPLMAGMILSAPYMIRGLYGARWAGAILPLQVLCFAAIPRAVHPLAGAVNRACNRVYSELWLQIGFAGSVLVGAIVGAGYGLAGVAVMVALAIVVMYFAVVRLALSITGDSWHALCAAHGPGLFLGTCTAAVLLPLRLALERFSLPDLTVFFILLAGGAASVPLGVYLFPPRVRPLELFDHLHAPLATLPTPLRNGLNRILRAQA